MHLIAYDEIDKNCARERHQNGRIAKNCNEARYQIPSNRNSTYRSFKVAIVRLSDAEIILFADHGKAPMRHWMQW